MFSGTTWTQLSQAHVEPMLTNDAQGMYRMDNHAWLFGWSNGTVFQVGALRARMVLLERCRERVLTRFMGQGRASQAPVHRSPSLDSGVGVTSALAVPPSVTAVRRSHETMTAFHCPAARACSSYIEARLDVVQNFPRQI